MMASYKKINVYFVRHAESTRNASMGMGSGEDAPLSVGLTEKGIGQARKLGLHLSQENFCKVYSSDYRRALETAKHILEQNSHAEYSEIITSETLRDMDFGKLNGSSYAEVTGHYVKSDGSLREWSFEDGESFYGCGQRMVCHFEQICKEMVQDAADTEDEPLTVLVVSHSLSLAAMFYYLSWTDAHSHEMVNWNGEADAKVLNNAQYYRLLVSKKQDDDSVDGRLRIEVLEKFASGHLAADVSGEESLESSNEKKRRAHEEKKRLVKALAASKKGTEILSCCHQ